MLRCILPGYLSHVIADQLKQGVNYIYNAESLNEHLQTPVINILRENNIVCIILQADFRTS